MVLMTAVTLKHVTYIHSHTHTYMQHFNSHFPAGCLLLSEFFSRQDAFCMTQPTMSKHSTISYIHSQSASNRNNK